MVSRDTIEFSGSPAAPSWADSLPSQLRGSHGRPLGHLPGGGLGGRSVDLARGAASGIYDTTAVRRRSQEGLCPG